MKKSTLLMIVSVVLAMTLSLGSTLAYLQDTDSDVNVMTLGNVYIEQHEYERAVDKNGNYEYVYSEDYEKEGYKLRDYTQNKPLYPAVGNVTGWDATRVYFDQLSDKATGGQAPLAGLNNVVDKFVLVENTGKSSAYVRSYIAFESGSLSAEEWDKMISTNEGDFWTSEVLGVYSINGSNYVVKEFVYAGKADRHADGILPAGEFTHVSLAQVYMDKTATNETVKALDGNNNGTYDIIVLSQAVQTAGFTSAAEALNEAFGVATEENENDVVNVVAWLGDVKAPEQVSTAAELLAALADGGEVILNKDITLSASDLIDDAEIASIPVGLAILEDTVLDLNGNDIKLDSSIKNGAVLFVHDADLVIKGEGTVQANDGTYAIWAKGDSKVDVMNGTFVGKGADSSVFYASGNVEWDPNSPWATINVYGGTFISESTDAQDYANVMNHGVGRVNYYGGTFSWNPATDIEPNDPKYIKVADGYEVITNADGNYTVTKSVADAEPWYTEGQKEHTIDTVEELFDFARMVNDDGKSFAGETIKLGADLNLDGHEWTPVGQTGGYYAATTFSGTFDGQNHTIYNLSVSKFDAGTDNGENYASGLFGFIDAHGATIKNLNVNGAKVSGHHWVAVIAGYMTGEISGCTVTGAEVVNSHLNDDACGDKAGVIVGYVNDNAGKIINNKAINCTVKAGRDAGQIIGAAYVDNITWTGNTVENVVVSANGDCTGANINNDIVGRELKQ